VRTSIVWLGLRALAVLDALWLRARRLKAAPVTKPVTAGAGIQSLHRVVFSVFGEIAWPEFSTLAHSFWRAQELTLFREHQRLFSEPVLDLGCGDSLFGQMAGFPTKGYGVDYDKASLAAARQLGSTLELVQADAGQLPLPDQCISVCLSNSVLEHLPDLGKCLKEVRRVLKPGGLFIFSMTLGSFTGQLMFWTGRRDAEYWLTTYGHLQQPSQAELLRLLTTEGFALRTCLPYQTRWTTAWYRFLVSPAVQFFGRHGGGLFRRRLQKILISRVQASVRRTQPGQGACVFVVAAKELA
jgi:ubiquinone/menaquinone biosynthesis C-methylase UbiE